MEIQVKRGQVLVLVALSLLALVAFVALAVDGGSLYRERRNMQNAADAGALAGAQELCFGTPANAEAQAREYATVHNEAEGAEVIISSNLVTVTVVATETYHTFFAGLVGFQEFLVQADATAICGKAVASSGIWPVGFNSTRWEANAPNLECGDTVIIWEGEAGTADCINFNCCVLYTDENKPSVLTTMDCSDGVVPDLVPLDTRAWLDFSAGLIGPDPCDSGTGIGADELKYRMEGENNKGETCQSYVEVPNCFAVPQGETVSAWNAAEAQGSRIVRLPLFDPCQSGTVGQPPLGDNLEIYPTGFCNDTPDTVCEIEGTSGGNERFYVNEFACIQIGIDDPDSDDWIVAARIYETDPSDNKSDWRRVLVATIPCDENGNPHPDCGSESGWTSGEQPSPGDVKAVTLVD